VTGGAPGYTPSPSGTLPHPDGRGKKTEGDKSGEKEKAEGATDEAGAVDEESEAVRAEEERLAREELRIAEKNKRITRLEEERARLEREAERALIVTWKEEYEWMFFKETEKVNEVLSKLKDDNLFLTQLNQDEEEEFSQIEQRQYNEAKALCAPLLSCPFLSFIAFSSLSCVLSLFALLLHLSRPSFCFALSLQSGLHRNQPGARRPARRADRAGGDEARVAV
jgi:hypothetical protein